MSKTYCKEDIGSTLTQDDDSNDHNVTDCKDKIVDDTNLNSDKDTKLSQLSYTEITQIASDITNMYNKATPQTKTIVASILFRTKDVLAYVYLQVAFINLTERTIAENRQRNGGYAENGICSV